MTPFERDTHFMNLAMSAAEQARSLGEVPVGAVLVRDDEVLATAHNLRETTHSPVAHAELRVIEEASRKLGGWRLAGATLYVTLEPCFMCAGAVILARIDRLVFGCRDPRAGAFGSLANLNDFPLNHKTAITEGVLQAACSEQLSSFFRALRRRSENKT